MSDRFADTSFEPLYRRVRGDLLERIRMLNSGDRLPSESDLCAAYGVSRITVRRAIADLVAEALLITRRGAGTFVRGHAPRPREFNLTGFLDERQILENRIIIDSADLVEEEITDALGLMPGVPVRHIRAVVHRDAEAFTVSDAYSTDDPAERLTAADYERTGTPLQPVHVHSARLGRQVVRAIQEFDAVLVDEVVAVALDLPVGIPQLRIRRVYFTAESRPIQYLIVRYHPRRYRFTADLLPRSISYVGPSSAGPVATNQKARDKGRRSRAIPSGSK